jgi:hypothetical protein
MVGVLSRDERTERSSSREDGGLHFLFYHGGMQASCSQIRSIGSMFSDVDLQHDSLKIVHQAWTR